MKKMHKLIYVIIIFLMAWLLISIKGTSNSKIPRECLAHMEYLKEDKQIVNNQQAEYLILGESRDHYLLGIIGNNKIKPIKGLPDYAAKNYIDHFFYKVVCPEEINEFPQDNSEYIDNLRMFRMKKDLLN